MRLSADVDAVVVWNVDVLGIVYTVFLTQMVHGNRDDLSKTPYTLIFAWLNEHINQRLCRDDFDTFIGLFELPSPQNMTSRPNSLDQILYQLRQ